MYNKENVFAKIIQGKIDCKEVYQDEQVLAFADIHPVAPVHILIVPKGEYESFDDFSMKASEKEIAHLLKSIRSIARKAGIEKSGYRIITNHGPDASQVVPHFHIHLIGGKPLGGLIPGEV